MAAENGVSQYELAVLVLAYLDQHKYTKSAASFKREAKQHFKAPGSAALPAGVRDLHDLLNDYVRLKEQEGQRLALAARNPLAARMQQLMDWEGAQAQAQGGDAAYAGLFGAHAAMPAAYAGMPQLAPLSGAAADGEPDDGDEEGQQGATPSRHRKGAPRKRRRGADPAAALGSAGMASLFGGGAWSPQDLLNLPLDASGLEALLDDGPLQQMFAEHLAQHINTTAGHPHPLHPGLGGSGTLSDAPLAPAAAACSAGGGGGGGGGGGSGSGTAGLLADLLADPQLVLADLPGDPIIANVLQQVVRANSASPPAARPASRPAAQQEAEGLEQQQRQQQRPEGHQQAAQQQQQQPVQAMQAAQQQPERAAPPRATRKRPPQPVRRGAAPEQPGQQGQPTAAQQQDHGRTPVLPEQPAAASAEAGTACAQAGSADAGSLSPSPLPRQPEQREDAKQPAAQQQRQPLQAVQAPPSVPQAAQQAQALLGPQGGAAKAAAAAAPAAAAPAPAVAAPSSGGGGAGGGLDLKATLAGMGLTSRDALLAELAELDGMDLA